MLRSLPPQLHGSLILSHQTTPSPAILTESILAWCGSCSTLDRMNLQTSLSQDWHFLQSILSIFMVYCRKLGVSTRMPATLANPFLLFYLLVEDRHLQSSDLKTQEQLHPHSYHIPEPLISSTLPSRRSGHIVLLLNQPLSLIPLLYFSMFSSLQIAPEVLHHYAVLHLSLHVLHLSFKCLLFTLSFI